MIDGLYTSACFDSPEQIVEDLASSFIIQNDIPGLAFLFCDSQIDYAAVAKLVAAKIPLPVVGGTALGFPYTDQNGEEVSASLLLIQKKGISVSVAVSDPLDQSRHTEQMREVYTRCLNGLQGAPALMMPFFPLIPGLITDLFITDIFEEAKTVPVFGGTTTGDLVSTQAAVFSGGEAIKNRMVLIMIAGDIRPVFSVGNKISTMVEYMPTVTKSDGNRVLAVDDMPFCDYMRTVGISPEDRINGVDALMQYGPTPVEMLIPGRPEDGVPVIRCISYTNLKEGSATFSGPVPEGTRLSLGILSKDDVVNSVASCLSDLRSQMQGTEEAGYTFSVVFAVSCVARYFVLVGSDNHERMYLMGNKPAGMPMSGYYAFCEIGPTKAVDDGRVLNRSHSASLVMCAF